MAKPTKSADKVVVKSVADHLDDISHQIQTASGYPYPEGSTVESNYAFAYGMAIGHMMALKRDWENRLGKL